MKLLKIVSNNFKTCKKDFSISFVPIANKYDVDKEFELNEIDDNLFVYSTIGVLGKNASGKTTTTDLMAIVYDIFGYFSVGADLSKKVIEFIDHSFDLDITFYDSGYLYRYVTKIEKNLDLVNVNSFSFKDEKLYKRKYSKTNSSKIFDYEEYDLITIYDNIKKPDDVSILFNVFNKKSIKALYYACNLAEDYNYNFAFNLYKIVDPKLNILISLIELFDDTIEELKIVSDDKYKIKFKNSDYKMVNRLELHEILSSGTSKGFVLMSLVIFSLKTGTDLIIDEIENHFHRTLVESIINLYKDKDINKGGATLIFTTHYGELLDQFSRNDNIYIAHNDGGIYLVNVYEKYLHRTDVLKSKKFYDNYFETNVKYDKLINFKKELMKDEY